jgi:hypothetical protein
MAKVAKSVVDVVLGEAAYGTRAERLEDMKHVYSVVYNRAAGLGVTPQQVIANKNEFNAYGKSLPPGVTKYTELAKEAIAFVEKNGPVTDATFYATPAAQHRLPNGLSKVGSTKGHNYFTDPQNRAIGTSVGYKPFNPTAAALARTPANIPTPTPRPDMPITMDQAAAAAMAQRMALNSQPVQQQVASLPEVGPVPTARPDQPAGKGLAALSPSFTGPQMAFKSSAAEKAFSSMAPEMQKAYAGIERGLVDPSSYTITSTAEPRTSVAKTHVRDKGAIDVRTTDRTQKQLDDLAIAAMYEPNIQNISWNNRRFAPHAHLGTSTAYGKGLNQNSALDGLSPDVQKAMQDWNASIQAGAAPGTIANHGRIAPESIAPRDLMSREQAIVSNIIDANNGIAGRSAVNPTEAFRSATPTPIERSPLGGPAPSITGDISMPDEGPVFAGNAPAVSMDQATAAARNRMSVAPTPSPRPAMTPGLGAVSPSQRTDMTSALNAQKASLQASRPSPTPSQKAELAAALNAQKASLRPSSPAATASANTALADAYKEMAKSMGKVGVMSIGGVKQFDPLQGTLLAPEEPEPVVKRVAMVPNQPPTPGLQPAPQRQQSAPRPAPPPANTGMDVWQGKANTGIATDGSQLQRNPDGSVTRQSGKYGWSTTTNPDGSFANTTAPGLFGLDAAVRSMFSDVARSPTQAKATQEQAVNPFSGQPINQPQGRIGRTAAAIGEPENAFGAGLGVLGTLFGGMPGGVLGNKAGKAIGRAVDGPASMSPREALTNSGRGYFPSAPSPMGTNQDGTGQQSQGSLGGLLGSILGGLFGAGPTQQAQPAQRQSTASNYGNTGSSNTGVGIGGFFSGIGDAIGSFFSGNQTSSKTGGSKTGSK